MINDSGDMGNAGVEGVIIGHGCQTVCFCDVCPFQHILVQGIALDRSTDEIWMKITKGSCHSIDDNHLIPTPGHSQSQFGAKPAATDNYDQHVLFDLYYSI
jgi:hypothetical protein